ncbi:uncharacterized protein ARMOST_02622 [Armillaria ostoyae]|uniref:Uncharacterized protein n=1 Tax=Armillaria ostoyae TaxID=47428 RepID=A0A284QS79_ARMOS|nr:uncharacterized protein ARMOST_02622 [Armillaria ostoyae]
MNPAGKLVCTRGGHSSNSRDDGGGRLVPKKSDFPDTSSLNSFTRHIPFSFNRPGHELESTRCSCSAHNIRTNHSLDPKETSHAPGTRDAYLNSKISRRPQ